MGLLDVFGWKVEGRRDGKGICFEFGVWSEARFGYVCGIIAWENGSMEGEKSSLHIQTDTHIPEYVRALFPQSAIRLPAIRSRPPPRLAPFYTASLSSTPRPLTKTPYAHDTHHHAGTSRLRPLSTLPFACASAPPASGLSSYSSYSTSSSSTSSHGSLSSIATSCPDKSTPSFLARI